jgi:hypothetical protein
VHISDEHREAKCFGRARTLPGRASGEPAPYLVPLVELVGVRWTAPELVARTRTLMVRVGQGPVTAMRETRGFVLNRLQAALVAEAEPPRVSHRLQLANRSNRCLAPTLRLRPLIVPFAPLT